jgi:hypothetical protein
MRVLSMSQYTSHIYMSSPRGTNNWFLSSVLPSSPPEYFTYITNQSIHGSLKIDRRLRIRAPIKVREVAAQEPPHARVAVHWVQEPPRARALSATIRPAVVNAPGPHGPGRTLSTTLIAALVDPYSNSPCPIPSHSMSRSMSDHLVAAHTCAPPPFRGSGSSLAGA